ncbi:uncharacterized protein LOC131157651 [Malania oleifera]|uniref:uncharacterized protein LOC131157651 n=1 Tax=Malania oleifera TaxID=397392 RepID=UPI0025AE0FED|nr:uncharacterized protein LOC131157651 [Malania oleifera]
MEERPSSSSSSSSHDTFLSSLLVLGGNPFRPFDICDFSGRCKWTVAVARSSKTAKAEPVFSPKFSIGGYACRLVFYPKGDPACQDRFSFHIQITDPTNHRWDCFAFFKIFIINHLNMLNSVCKESGDRFTDRKTSHGCKFTRSSILDPKLGFYFDDSLLIVVEIRVLKDLLWCRDNNDLNSASDVLSGNYTWKIQNFSVFQEVIATQRITSPVIKAGPFNLALSLSQSVFNGVECLSLYLEGKGASFWCLFRLSVLSQKVDGHVHKTLSERLGLEVILVRTRKVGWGDYMKMSELVNLDNGFLFDDAVEISVSYFVIKDFFHLSKNVGFLAGSRARGPKKHDEYAGKITWKIGNFTKLKDLLRKKKIKGIHVRSERVLIGNRHCSLVVYPRVVSCEPKDGR